MAFPVQEYVSVISGANSSSPVQMYVAVVDSSGNLVSSTYNVPGGRLTLTTAVPVLTSTVSASATVLYTPYADDVCPIFDGVTMIPTKFTELTNTLSDATTNPAAGVSNANYDLFVWNNAGTMTLSRGPLWSKSSTVTTPVATPGVVNWTGHGLLAGTPVSFSGGVLPTGIVAGTTYYVIAAGLTANAFEISATVGGSAINFTGTSSGTQTGVAGNDTARTNATDLTMQNGILLNTLAITNGPAASRGTYVGTIRTDSAGVTVSYIFGAAGASGTAALLGLWNCYNRVDVSTFVRDTSAGYTYTTATIRAANASNTMRFSTIRGLNEDAVDCIYQQRVQTAAAALAAPEIGIGIDATNAYGTGTTPAIYVDPSAAVAGGSLIANYRGLPGLGFHFLQALEKGDGTNANTFNVITGSFSGLYTSVRG